MSSAPGGRRAAGWALAALAACLVLIVLLAPRGPADARGALTTHSAAAGGARGLYEGLGRLGWRVERRELPFPAGTLDTGAVYAVLGTAMPVTAGETHALLDAVRNGAGLLVVVANGSPLADSLGVQRATEGGPMVPVAGDFCPDSLNREGLLTWPDDRVWSHWLTRLPRAGVVTFATARVDTLGFRAPADPDARERSRVARPAIAGFPLGRGRVVAVADPDVLRNDVLRVCRWNAAQNATRAVEWLAAGGARRVVFDEFRNGYGVHADPMGAIGDALGGTGAGRMVLQLAVAALVLLAAAGIRAIPPRPRTVVERRSPLEHVGALARAYEQVGATRLAARRLVRGLRRRHGMGTRAGVGDEEFLVTLAARRRGIAADVALLQQALAERRPARELEAVGEAVARIDDALRAGP